MTILTELVHEMLPQALAQWLIIAVGLAALALCFYRAYNALAYRRLHRIYDDVRVTNRPEMGYVAVHFHTYHGFVAWISQTEHCVYVAAEDAQRVLNRLLCFNLTWGLLTPGLLSLVPLAVLVDYLFACHSVRKQRAKCGMPKNGRQQGAVVAAPTSPPKARMPAGIFAQLPCRGDEKWYAPQGGGNNRI